MNEHVGYSLQFNFPFLSRSLHPRMTKCSRGYRERHFWSVPLTGHDSTNHPFHQKLGARGHAFVSFEYRSENFTQHH